MRLWPIVMCHATGTSDKILRGLCCLSLLHREGSEQYMQNFIFRLKRMIILRRRKHRWEDNIKMDFMKVKYEAVACSHVSRDWNQ